MRSRSTKSIAGLLLSLGFAAAAATATTVSPRLIDPVFGLEYRPDRIHFEPAPPGLLVTCPDLVNARWTRKLWIYSQVRRQATEYLVVGGFYVNRPPAPARLETDPKGAILQTSASGCTLLGPAREVFQFPEGLVAKPVLTALAADLVRRYRAAFGGRAAMQAQLEAQHASPADPRDALLRDALAARR
jgi:hypothetical protein